MRAGMKGGARLRRLLAKALVESMSTDLMVVVAERVIPGYDIYERTGYQRSIPIPPLTVANQIIRDVGGSTATLRLLERLIAIDETGFMGRRVPVRSLAVIVREAESLGYVYDRSTGVFLEGPRFAKTSAWSYLREGSTYELSFMQVDVAGSTPVVRSEPRVAVDGAWADLKCIVGSVVERRSGRLWQWEGDGGVAAFLFGGRNVQATLTGMEILLELFLWNTFRCRLGCPLRIRIAVHAGPCLYHESFPRIQSDTLRRLELIESRYTDADSVTLSAGVHSDLGPKLSRLFSPFDGDNGSTLHRWRLDWEP